MNVQSRHGKALVSFTKSGVYISTLSPGNCIVHVIPGNFVIVACLACLPVNESVMPINILSERKFTKQVFQ